jgi:hypothetical protein
MFQRVFIAAAALCATAAQASISVDSAAFQYSQSFDSLATSGSALPWVNDSTLAGWSLFNKDGMALSSYAADTGASNAGAFKSLGNAGSGERAFGGVGSGGSYFASPASGAVAGWMAVALHNDSGAALTGVNLGFDGEQWRNGGNTSAQTLALEYGIGADFGSVATWTAAGAGFDFSSPVIGASSGMVDGNGAGLTAGLGGSIAVAWAADETLWLRWVEVNDAGNDHGLAIDNLSLSVSAVPEPGSSALLLAGLATIGFIVRRRA